MKRARKKDNNDEKTLEEPARLELNEKRGRPYGEDVWAGKMATRLGLE